MHHRSSFIVIQRPRDSPHPQRRFINLSTLEATIILASFVSTLEIMPTTFPSLLNRGVPTSPWETKKDIVVTISANIRTFKLEIQSSLVYFKSRAVPTTATVVKLTESALFPLFFFLPSVPSKSVVILLSLAVCIMWWWNDGAWRRAENLK